jgi:hypothetical protein
MEDKKIDIDLKEAKNIVNAIEGLFDLGFFDKETNEVKERLKSWLENNDKE